MLAAKLQKIKDLIVAKEQIDAELAHLLGDGEKPKRGRPKKAGEESDEGPIPDP